MFGSGRNYPIGIYWVKKYPACCNYPAASHNYPAAGIRHSEGNICPAEGDVLLLRACM